jgi:hypothetical protein
MRRKKSTKNKKTGFCVGFVDEVYDASTGKLIGYVGFHEYDGYIEIMELRNRVKEAARKLGLDIFCFDRKRLHFKSYTILRKSEREKWKRLMQKMFPSDYLQDAKHRVLRIGKKGTYMKPKLLICYFMLPETRKKRPLSDAHMIADVEEGIVPAEQMLNLIKYNRGNVKKTMMAGCIYPVWIPKNMRAASLKKNERGEAALKSASLKKARFNAAR